MGNLLSCVSCECTKMRDHDSVNGNFKWNPSDLIGKGRHAKVMKGYKTDTNEMIAVKPFLIL